MIKQAQNIRKTLKYKGFREGWTDPAFKQHPVYDKINYNIDNG